MKKVLVVLIAMTFVFSVYGCGGGKGGKPLVSVGGTKITEGDLDFLAVINPRLKAQMISEFGRKKILDNLVEQELLYKAALKEGLDKDKNVKDKIDIYRKVIISQALMDKKLEESARKYYDEHKSEFEKIKISHILIKENDGKKKRGEKETLDIANKAKERIEKGEAFDVVAKEISEDEGTSKRGGDLGLVAKDEARLTRRGYAPLLEKAFTMKVGEVGGPIKTEDGYHIITVTKGAEVVPFEEASQGILFKIRANARNDILKELKEKFKVTYLTPEAEPKAPTEETPPAGTQPGTPPEGVKAPDAAPEGQGAAQPQPAAEQPPVKKGTIKLNPIHGGPKEATPPPKPPEKAKKK